MNKKGFTLLELLVTATLIAVLTVIGIVSYTSVNKRSRDVKRKSDMEQVRSALEMFRSDSTTSEYPHTGIPDGQFSNFSVLSTSLVSTYLPSIPTDPGSNTYYYQAIPTGGRYATYCVCAKLENVPSGPGTCTISLPASCNYGLKNP